MKKLALILLSLTLILTLTAGALAENDGEIVVSGNATVWVAADMATLQVGVETVTTDVTKGQSDNAAAISAILTALKDAGVADEDLSTSNFNVYSGYDYSGKNPVRNYTVTNMLTVTVRDLDKVGSLIDTAVAAGANQIYGLNFLSSKENEAFQKALTRAVEDAKAKAETLAQAAGVTLGALEEISSASTGYDYGVSNVYDAKEMNAGGSTIVAGDVQVYATVTLTYDLK